MGHTNKDLLLLERKSSPPTSFESTLLVKKESASQEKKPLPDGKKPTIFPVPKSQVLGKVRDFLEVMSEANKRLQFDAQDNGKDCDIEALTGDESEYIEMDLMLGVADLHTTEAVAAAESALSGNQSTVSVASSPSSSESEESSDDDDLHEDDNGISSPSKPKRHLIEDSNTSKSGKKRLKKRPKIVELS